GSSEWELRNVSRTRSTSRMPSCPWLLVTAGTSPPPGRWRRRSPAPRFWADNPELRCRREARGCLHVIQPSTARNVRREFQFRRLFPDRSFSTDSSCGQDYRHYRCVQRDQHYLHRETRRVPNAKKFWHRKRRSRMSPVRRDPVQAQTLFPNCWLPHRLRHPAPWQKPSLATLPL